MHSIAVSKGNGEDVHSWKILSKLKVVVKQVKKKKKNLAKDILLSVCRVYFVVTFQ